MSTGEPHRGGGLINAIVRVFLHSNLSIVLVIIAAVAGAGALLITPREEDPQIVVPFADVVVAFPGHSAQQVEQLVTTPLERLLYQIDGVEYVYSRSMRDRAIITVRFFVGQDRERSLVKISKRLDENIDLVPPGVSGWVVKPREIDDVPIVTLTLASDSGDTYTTRRLAEELAQRLSGERDISRVDVLGGQPRIAGVRLDREALHAFSLAPDAVLSALSVSNVAQTAGVITRNDELINVGIGDAFATVDELRTAVVGVWDGQPVHLQDVARVIDGPDEPDTFLRHGWGPARDLVARRFETPGSTIGSPLPDSLEISRAAVTIAISKKKGTNAVAVAERIIRKAAEIHSQLIPENYELIVTRNSGQTADHKVNELVEGLGVAIIIVVTLLTIGLGWRESIIVVIAIPVVFGLTLLVNLLFGYTINRVTLFALILSLGLIVDDPIVDVENIARLFGIRKRATREIVLEAVAEIRPPLIVATLAVIASFLPLAFITGMMGPYMAPMALNVPVSMLMSMLVAFTITPWLSYHLLRRRYSKCAPAHAAAHDEDDIDAARGSLLDRLFRPTMSRLIASRRASWGFLGVILLLTTAAASLGAFRKVPLKMLPFDNKNEFLLVIDHDEGATLERTDATVRAIESLLAATPEVTDFTSYVGLNSPIDFNGLVRQYYFRTGENLAEIRVNLAPRKQRAMQSHAIGLRLREQLDHIAARHDARIKVVELPPGPPVVSTFVAEVRGPLDAPLDDLARASQTIVRRLALEPGVVDLDDSVAAESTRLDFIVDREKAALNGVSSRQIASVLAMAVGGADAGILATDRDRFPVPIRLRLPESDRSSTTDLGQIGVAGADGSIVPLAEIGTWVRRMEDRPIFHKNLERVVYVFAEIAGRTPPEVVIDLMVDRERVRPAAADPASLGHVEPATVRPADERTFIRPGGGVSWWVDPRFDVKFSGEGEWKITLEVFRDLGLAFAAALVAIFILLSAQFRSFLLPVVVMLAIPLTVIGIMPGFWLLNVFGADVVNGYRDPVLFTATAMIGMIALAGIVTRQSTILVDFIHLALSRGKPLREALIASCVVRLRPILLTASTAMLSAAPIVIDPIFSGLAWALIFGLGAATIFTIFVIPVVYWLIYSRRHAPRP
ncbi:MAG: efflux RND transporter permease subunit [Leptolyngbya sp. PLA3]|nr:MAG: efflux RND transporter permease subunit [Cyanobacteria bacterium CYA]MCE7969366.1 efflux RND transporter permease subunit [Leptolyngbya sp. PL-A3]